MRTAFKVLAGLIALEVVIQAAAMVYAIAGLGIWVAEDGGVLDQASFESGESLFPEMIGFMVHGMNGMMVIPLLALLLLITSFFAKVPGGVKFAGLVLLAVVVQVTLGLLGHSAAIFGMLHGINALILFSLAVYTTRLAMRPAADEAAVPPGPRTKANSRPRRLRGNQRETV